MTKFCFATALVCAINTATRGQSYEITPIPIPLGASNLGYAYINKNQQVVVNLSMPVNDSSSTAASAIARPYLWAAGVLTPLNVPVSWGNASALGINDQGTVVGNVFNGSGLQQPVMWSNNNLTALDTGSMSTGTAFSINSQGQIAGLIGSSSYTNYRSDAAVWNGTDLTDLGSYGAQQAGALKVNNSGQAIIEAGDSTTPVTTSLIHDNSSDHVLAPLGTKGTFVIDINNVGQVLAHYSNQNYVWQDDVYTPLNHFPTTSSDHVSAINSSGQVVGSTFLSDGVEIALLWNGSNPVDLNSLLPPDSGWQLDLATSISDDGSIVGRGFYEGTEGFFLLAPQSSNTAFPTGVGSTFIPEPRTLLLVMLATAYATSRRLMKRAID